MPDLQVPEETEQGGGGTRTLCGTTISSYLQGAGNPALRGEDALVGPSHGFADRVQAFL